ncbi:LuxR C-terminal-related transcriptional regulator [Enterobacter asburiae]
MPSGLFVNRKQRLSPREREVLGALLQGASYKTTAEKFRITEKTVSIHKARGGRKLGVKNFHHLYLTYRYWQRCLRLQTDLSPSYSVMCRQPEG